MVVIIGGRMSDEEKLNPLRWLNVVPAGPSSPLILSRVPNVERTFLESQKMHSASVERAIHSSARFHELSRMWRVVCGRRCRDILRKWVADTGINIRKLFDRFDDNNDGTIDSSELKEGLLSLNLADLPPSQVDRLVAQIDADGNGLIDLDEFDTILSGTDAESDESSNRGFGRWRNHRGRGGRIR